MKAKTRLPITCVLFLIFLFVIGNENAIACSTFKLQKGNELIYGHNLNQADMDVPGMAFINKRGIFKNGRTFLELLTKARFNKSSFSWISRYGSVTFNNFGRDFPDGGMNEVGLYIWEMNEDAKFPKNRHKPKLMMMNWMQYILDNCSTLDEAIQCASEFRIDDALGMMTWHYFISDASGNCASLTFINGKAKVNRGENMPIPALFNTPYDREMELLKYYKGFGGLYDIELNNTRVPRFVKTAALLKDFDPSQNAVEYGFKMLKTIKVDNEPEWSVLFDAGKRNVYFRTRLNPEIKHFPMDSLDFSNNSPTQILDIDIKDGGDVLNQFQAYSNEAMKTFLNVKMRVIIPEKEFDTFLLISYDEFCNRFAYHGAKAELSESQYFAGKWKTKPPKSDKDLDLILKMWANKDAVFGEIGFYKSSNVYPIEHISLQGNNLIFTYKDETKTLMQLKATLKKGNMKIHVQKPESDLGYYRLYKEK